MNDYEPEKKKGLLSGLFGVKNKETRQPPALTDDKHPATAIGNGEQVDGGQVDEAPPPIVISGKHSDKNKIAEELLRQKAELEHEKTLDRRVIQEKTQKINVTMELNVQIQKELDEKDETIRMLEDKNTVLKRTIDAKVDELETLKQQVSLLEQELSSRSAEKKKLLEEKKELVVNINLHGWLCKRGIKGPTADVWRQRYFKLEEGNKLKYYKKPAEGSAQGYIDIDKIISVKQIPEVQQNNYIFHVVTEGRTYELSVSDEATMNKWISGLQYIKEWRAKRKQKVNH